MKRKHTDIDIKATGERIKFFMEKKGVSRKELAEAIDVTINAITNYLNGYNLPDTEKLYKICKYLDVELCDIIVEKGRNIK